MSEGLTSRISFLLSTSSLGRWCNGNTTGFGPVIWGSSPYRPATFEKPPSNRGLFLWLSIAQRIRDDENPVGFDGALCVAQGVDGARLSRARRAERSEPVPIGLPLLKSLRAIGGFLWLIPVGALLATPVRTAKNGSLRITIPTRKDLSEAPRQRNEVEIS